MINDIKWVQAQREATDWRQAVEIATRPLVAYGAAQPCYVNGIIENTLTGALLSDSPRNRLASRPTRARRKL